MNSTQPTDVDAYIRDFPERIQKILQSIRRAVSKSAPDAVESIKYRMPTFVLRENLVHFAAFQNHIGFYPTPSTIAAFKDELKDFVWSKGAVQFPLGRPIPMELIRRMVAFRVAEVRAKVPGRNAKK